MKKRSTVKREKSTNPTLGAPKKVSFNEENIAKTSHNRKIHIPITEANTPFAHQHKTVDAHKLHAEILARLSKPVEPKYEDSKSSGSFKAKQPAEIGSYIKKYPPQSETFEEKRKRFDKAEYEITKQRRIGEEPHPPIFVKFSSPRVSVSREYERARATFLEKVKKDPSTPVAFIELH